MRDFKLWFTEGFYHIADLHAYDHILFLIVLFGGFILKDWKKVLVLITAFTVGHSITLALSVLNIVRIKSPLVEFLIPCTILVTAVYNMVTLKKETNKNNVLHYGMAVFFGLIHGLGFSGLLRSLLGKTQHIGLPLLSFNLGIEAGQLVIISILFIVTIFFVKIVKIPAWGWRFFLSAASFGVALMMALERIPLK